jgi:hypothetical protein
MGPVDVGDRLQGVGLALDGALGRLLQVVVEGGLHHQPSCCRLTSFLSAHSTSHLRT